MGVLKVLKVENVVLKILLSVSITVKYTLRAHQRFGVKIHKGKSRAQFWNRKSFVSAHQFTEVHAELRSGIVVLNRDWILFQLLA